MCLDREALGVASANSAVLHGTADSWDSVRPRIDTPLDGDDTRTAVSLIATENVESRSITLASENRTLDQVQRLAQSHACFGTRPGQDRQVLFPGNFGWGQHSLQERTVVPSYHSRSPRSGIGPLEVWPDFRDSSADATDRPGRPAPVIRPCSASGPIHRHRQLQTTSPSSE